MTKKPVLYYKQQVKIPGAREANCCTRGGSRIGEKVVNKFNEAWGFEDGHCNYRAEDGSLQGLPGADNEYFSVATACALHRSLEVTLLIAVYKDGRRKVVEAL